MSIDEIIEQKINQAFSEKESKILEELKQIKNCLEELNGKNQQYMTISDLMKYLQIKKTKARQLHSKNGLGVKVGGSVRFKKSEIDEYLQKNGKTVKIKYAVFPIQD